MKKIICCMISVMLCLSTLSLFACEKKISFEFEYAGEQGYILTRAEVPRTETTLVIPDTYRGLPVYYIDHNAFDHKGFYTIDVGKNTKVIASGAFYHCHPDTLNLRNVTEIQEEAFRYHYLQELVIPATVETIETWAFASSLVNSTDVYFLGDPAILEENIFYEVDNCTFHAKAGGNAEAYAQKYGYNFEELTLQDMQKLLFGQKDF